MAFLLDTNILSYFLNLSLHDSLAKAAEKVPIAVVAEVRVEAEAHRTLGAQFTAWLPTTSIAVREIELGTPAHARLLELLPDASVLRTKAS